MRKIPACMATQHPDNADKPYWYYKPFISASAEIKECYQCFSDLGIDEYNWDWEGKFVDEAVVDRLLSHHLTYFQKHPLGKDKFLTFRIPNPRVEKQFRLARAFMVIVTSSQLARTMGFSEPPIFETILPLTETAEEIIDIQQAFNVLIGIEHKLLKMEESVKHIEIIPLFEQVNKIMDSDRLIKKYVTNHKKIFGYKPEYIRPYCARSDPALNSGLVPTMLALKVALSKYRSLEKEIELKLYPMLGTGSLPFRGGVTPDNIDKSLDEYAGICTLILQSAFRYDYPKRLVKKSVKRINDSLCSKSKLEIEESTINNVKKAIPLFEHPYRRSIEKIAGLINHISKEVGKRRERVLHIGLFGYSRGIGNVVLPRAIPFTASLYSIGIPPEFIGTGRGIKESKKRGLWDDISYLYKHFREDFITAGHYINKENLAVLASKNNTWSSIREDILSVEKELKVEFGPKNAEQFEHQRITGRILNDLNGKKKVSALITEAGKLRKSLG